MPAPKKYSLEPLLELRRQHVDEAKAELGNAIRSREAAGAAQQAAEHARRRSAEQAQAVRDDEASRLARGELRVSDLARAGAWEVSAEAEKVAREQDVDTATLAHQESRGVEHAARAELAVRRAGQEVIEKDRARFFREREQRARAAEEEAAEEAFRAGRGTRG